MSVDLDPTADQLQILDAARAMLTAHYPIERLHAYDGDPMVPLAEFGLFTLSLPENAGGIGFTLVEEALLHVEIGQHLVDPAALAGAVAMRIAQDTGMTDVSTGIADGTRPVAPGIATGDGALFLAAHPPELALLREDRSLALVDLSLVDSEPVPGMGASHTLYRIDSDQHPDVLARASAGARDAWQVLLAAELLGIARYTLALTVEHALAREQFGRPIGAFQVIKHRCADMAIRCERLDALLDLATITVSEQHDEAAFNIAALVTLAPGIALDNARAAIQVHGAMGFSAEALPHCYLKQAHRLSSLLLPVDMCAASSPLAR